MREITVENSPSTPSVAAFLLLGACVLTRPPLPLNLLPDHGSTSGVRLELENVSAIVGPLPAPLDYALESPDFVPQQLRDFAARDFDRRNRWS
jgi:hypothetical protein